jgi:hypothetical protein
MDNLQFIPGLELAEGFFFEAVKPIINTHYPNLRYSAGLIGFGSEVLGFDTEMSADHHWGPRVMLFLGQKDFELHRNSIRNTLSKLLPVKYCGYSTHFSEPNLDDGGTQVLVEAASPPVNHRVEMFTIGDFFAGYMNISIHDPLDVIDWLTLPQQKLRSIVAGKIFHDALGMNAIRQRFSWYPHDVWLYLLASCWTRIGQEEHLMGRAGIVNDEIGSGLIGAILVKDIMRLAFLMEKTYFPYAKWFGSAFSRLPCAATLGPILKETLHARDWTERETYLCQAYETIAEMHNALGITALLPTKPAQFWGRPFRIIKGDRFANAIIARIEDPAVKRLLQERLIGNIDLLSDNTDLLEDESRREKLKKLLAISNSGPFGTVV